jgi:hypothetical protein
MWIKDETPTLEEIPQLLPQMKSPNGQTLTLTEVVGLTLSSLL